MDKSTQNEPNLSKPTQEGKIVLAFGEHKDKTNVPELEANTKRDGAIIEKEICCLCDKEVLMAINPTVEKDPKVKYKYIAVSCFTLANSQFAFLFLGNITREIALSTPGIGGIRN